MGEAEGTWLADVSAVAALHEPTRRRLYEFVVRQPAPVSRDQAADAVRAPRPTVAFHLDKLVAEGLLEVVYERRTGRTGPGAGRPSKLYRRAAQQITVSLPDRRYELAARLLADTVHEAQSTGESPRAVLDQRARELGRQLGRELGGQAHTDLMGALETFGFEPRATGDTIVLGNCPFHSLARRHTELVCGMNLCLLDGMLDGLAATDVTARLEPGPGHCCVRFHPAPDVPSP
ncbi:MAG TPA: helix-turn-helix domain-containing protein [Streptosporangiaceae bacterium]|nr:helix-turn-helix domain-containing protein [Streptosporangiaceae bacterium]